MKTNKMDNKGLVSIVVCMLLMAIITLVTVGFARIMQREYRQAIDNQLSSQAFYAAESATNEVRNNLAALLNSKTTCASTEGGVSWSYNLDSINPLNPDTAVTCLTIDLKPPRIVIDAVPLNEARAIPIVADGGAIDTLNISFSSSDGNFLLPSNFATFNAASPVFLPVNSYNVGNVSAIGVLRLDLVPTSGAQDRASLRANTKTFFVYPVTGNATSNNAYSLAAITAGQVITAPCNAARVNDRACSFSLNGLSGTYFMRLRSIYSELGVSITGTTGGTRINFVGAQAQIDSTGRAQDVLKRIRTAVPINKDFVAVDYGQESPSVLCKIFSASPGLQTDSCTSSYDIQTVTDKDGDGNLKEATDAYFVVGCVGDSSTSGCGSGVAGLGSSIWQRRFTNLSNNSSVTSCTWTIVDSDPTKPLIPSGSIVLSNQACNMGDRTPVQTFTTADPTKCYSLTASLNITANGQPSQTYVTNFNVPNTAACNN